eukprot:gb/GFBE01003661.1/.p1 GENE.gb/GFBE01003661.1/~~gb/GFBE01003661.1/.p1  ORF type:complete len:228 (+),score=27.19 gb/GFBE01003661.1/:1-684(+)
MSHMHGGRQWLPAAGPQYFGPPRYSEPEELHGRGVASSSSRSLRSQRPASASSGFSTGSRASSSSFRSSTLRGDRMPRQLRSSQSDSYLNEALPPRSPFRESRMQQYYHRRTPSDYGSGALRSWTPNAHMPEQPFRWVPPGFIDWQRPPAGHSTFEQDRPESARRVMAANDGFGCAWRDAFPGVASDTFGRNNNFTKSAYFRTAQQSHGTDLRRITRVSPNHVTRVC